MTIVPLTTPLPVYALEVFGHEVFAPLSWLVAGLAVLASRSSRRWNAPGRQPDVQHAA